jgi:hypothetical protein
MTIEELREEYGSNFGYPFTPSGKYTKHYTQWLEKKIVKLNVSKSVIKNADCDCEKSNGYCCNLLCKNFYPQ